MTRPSRAGKKRRRAREWWVWRDRRQKKDYLLVPSNWGEKQIKAAEFAERVETVLVREVLLPRARRRKK